MPDRIAYLIAPERSVYVADDFIQIVECRKRVYRDSNAENERKRERSEIYLRVSRV